MKSRLRVWLIMAGIDICVVSLLTPLSFYVALLYSSQDPKFPLFMGLLIFLNAITYSLGWVVSWKIYSKPSNNIAKDSLLQEQ